MKKLLSLNLTLLVLLIACSSSVDESKVLANYSNSKYFKEMKTLEQKQDKNESEYTQLVINYHNLALESKNIDVTNLMLTKIEKVKDNHYSNPVITAYYGSTTSMIGRDSSNPVNKIAAVKKGASYIDDAVKKDSNNVRLRILRAEGAIQLPSFFNRLKYALEDYEFLVSNYESKKFNLDKELMAMVYQHQGDAFKKVDKIKEAISAWKKCIKILSGSQYAEEANKMLSIYDEE